MISNMTNFSHHISGLFILLCITIMFCGCNDEKAYLPKPRMYPKVEFPERVYSPFSGKYCQFQFQMPSYAQVEQDKLFFDEEPMHPCWFDLKFTPLNSSLHFSYYPIKNTKDFDKLVQDAFNIAGKHNIRADFRDEFVINIPENKVHGLIFEIGGPVASPFQFYLTDSTTHFLRASLYINDVVNPDSTKIVYEFLKEDILHMIESFEWEK
jgi:gliding motility-associated lipoprotein GldD